MRRDGVLPLCWGALELRASVKEGEGHKLIEEEFDPIFGMCLDCMTVHKLRGRMLRKIRGGYSRRRYSP